MLTRLGLYLLLIVAPLIALGTLTPAAYWSAALYTVALLALMGADFLLSPRTADFRLSRTNDDKLSLGADNPVRITVRWARPSEARGGRASSTRFVVRDEPPAEFVTSEMFLRGEIAPGQSAELPY